MLYFRTVETLPLSNNNKTIVMNSINLNTSTPIKRIRFRGDSFQADNEPLLDNDSCDEPSSTKNGDLPKERGLFTKEIAF